MPETLQRHYHSISDMDQEEAAVPWKKFFVHLSGRTNGAHTSFVAKLKRVGQTEVDSAEQSDYILLFCPVASRVGTDISEAQDNIPGGKPAILVVMHHSFNRDHVVADSRRLATNPNVHLTVDCVFYNGKLLECNRNEIAWFEVQKLLGVSASQVSNIPQSMKNCWNYLKNNPRMVLLAFASVGMVMLVAVLVVYLDKNNN